MAGTDRSRTAVIAGPSVILVDPQLGENIGMAARAMMNCGLTDLRLVRPRDGWPSDKAAAAAAGADAVLEKATLFETTADAVADCHRVLATTARRRGMIKSIVTPRRAAADMRRAITKGEQGAVLFGAERRGLTNDDLALADAVIEVPLNPAFASLNLAQAVLVIGYEWFQSGADAPDSEMPLNTTRPATKAELVALFEHLERELDTCGFLHVAEKRPIMVRNIRNMFQRAALTEQEVRTLRGIITGLTNYGRK